MLAVVGGDRREQNCAECWAYFFVPPLSLWISPSITSVVTPLSWDCQSPGGFSAAKHRIFYPISFPLSGQRLASSLRRKEACRIWVHLGEVFFSPGFLSPKPCCLISFLTLAKREILMAFYFVNIPFVMKCWKTSGKSIYPVVI